MRYYKIISNGYVLVIGTGAAGEEITKNEYDEMMSVIDNRPAAPDGYAYRLTEKLEWELAKTETPDIGEEATAEDYQAALAEMGVQI